MKYEVVYIVSSPSGRFDDTVFDSWSSLLRHMETIRICSLPVNIHVGAKVVE